MFYVTVLFLKESPFAKAFPDEVLFKYANPYEGKGTGTLKLPINSHLDVQHMEQTHCSLGLSLLHDGEIYCISVSRFASLHRN